MTLRDALLEASTHIARRDAETLLAHILQQERAWVLAHTEDALSPAELATFRSLVSRRAALEPLQYLTGTQEFFGLPLRVTPGVLIPRPETEHVVEAVLEWAREQSVKTLRIADIGTGSGAIALALAAHLPEAQILATDRSAAALAVALANASRLQLADRLRLLEGDLLSPLSSNDLPLDVVVSNPPYVADTDAPTLAPEVREHEPHLALFAGPDGLAVYRRLIPQAFTVLRPGGLLALEIGFGQHNALTQLLDGWQNVRFVEDYAGIPRVALAIRLKV